MRSLKLGLGWVLTVLGWMWVVSAIPGSIHTKRLGPFDSLEWTFYWPMAILAVLMGVAAIMVGSALRRAANRRTARTERSA